MRALAAGIALTGAVLLLGGPGATAGSAQEPGAVTTITLDEAVQRARGNNPAYRRTVNSLELNRIENREFWLGFLPQPELRFLDTNMQWNRTTVATDNFGNPIENPELRMIQSASSSQRASLTFQVDLGDFFRRRVDRARAERRVAEAELQARSLGSDVRLAFLDAQEMLQLQELEERFLEVRETNREITTRLFGLARTDRLDILGAELDYTAQESDLEQSGAGLRTTLLRLRNLIGDPALGEIAVEPVPLRVFDPQGLDEEALVAAALDAGPRVTQERFSVRQLEREASVQRTYWLPTLSLSAGTSREQFSRESGSGFLRPIPDGEWGRRVSFSVRFPDLGQYFGRQTTTQRSELDVLNADESLREARLQVEEEVRSLLLDLHSQYATLTLQERRADLARERLELQQERYELGRDDYRAVQSASETATTAERQALQARYAFERALIRLEQALGAPLEIPAEASSGSDGG